MRLLTLNWFCPALHDLHERLCGKCTFIVFMLDFIFIMTLALQVPSA